MSLRIQAGEPPRPGELLRRERVLSRVENKEALIAAFADDILERGWVAEDEREWLRLCLEETITNAMVHGNEGDPALPVEVELWRDGADWVLIVSDQGDGFDPQQVPDPDDPDTLLYEHGRGILLMRGWLDSLQYYRGGASAVLRRGIAITEEAE